MRPRPIYLALVLVVAACGASRDAILSRTKAGLDAAHVAFVEHVTRREAAFAAEALAIPKNATSLEAGKVALVEQWLRLQAFRGKVDKCAAAFVAAYAAVGAASLDLDPLPVADVLALASKVIQSLRDLGIVPGGGTP